MKLAMEIERASEKSGDGKAKLVLEHLGEMERSPTKLYLINVHQ